MVSLNSLAALSLSFLLLTLLLCVAEGGSFSSPKATKIGQGYRLISIEDTPDGALVGLLQVKQRNNIYGPDIPLLRFYVKHETENRLRGTTTPSEADIKRSRKNSILVLESEYSGSELVFSYTSDPFSFAVKRKSNGDTLFDSSSNESDPFGPLVFKDQYLEISTKLPKDASLYGLGENTQPNGIKLYPNDPYTLYTTDISAINLNADFMGHTLPAPMPYWAFGFHQCRWGYHNLSVVEDVVENYNKAKIPLDVIWNDDDHMDGHKDFTLNPINYPRPKLLNFLDKIHNIGMKYIVIIDPGIAVNSSYGVYQRGMANDFFIKYEDCKNITGTRWDDPPYKINASGVQAPIGFKTIATSAVHYNGVLEYDAHSIFGFSQAIATHKALLGLQGKRPFVLSRSTYVGSGKYAAHWTGDNKGTWEDLRYSITTVLNFGIFWHANGIIQAMAPQDRNVTNGSQWLSPARNALGMRYKLLPYLYTLNYEAHISGAPIARPLFFSFPTYTECYGLSTQFLLGSSLMISPVLEKGKTQVKALFPPGTWYSLFDLTQAIVSKDRTYVTLDAPLHVINVHLYQNTILPMQQGGMVSKDARMTPFTLIVTFPAGANEGEAKGNLFLDDDELPEMKLGNGYSTFIDFYATVKEGSVKVWSEVQEGKFALDKGLVIDTINVLGLSGSGAVATIEIDGKPAMGVSNVEVSVSEHKYLYEQGDGENTIVIVGLEGLNIPVGKNFAMSWKMGS
ncbi:Glycosyl hydrolase, all-beta [Sesbania bispinosa]|nr:Glycosyl hydrolase, all-beta [Sesbania bispinosa]